MTPEPIQFDREEILLLLVALAMAASRRESQARVIKHGRRHDEEAIRMRRLRFRLMKHLPSMETPS